MRTVTNEDRANKASVALEYYGTSSILGNTVSDLLADLMHLCDQEKIDFNLLLQNAQWNYREEVKEEQS